MKEVEIIAGLKDGDNQAMEALIQQYGPFLRYILTPILRNASEREECFSEVIARIWQKQAQYDPGKGSWKAWMAAIARNTALNWNRHYCKYPTKSGSFFTESITICNPQRRLQENLV